MKPHDYIFSRLFSSYQYLCRGYKFLPGFLILILILSSNIGINAQPTYIYASADSTGDGHNYELATSIGDALDRALNKDSAVVFLKPGTYNISETLELNLSRDDTAKITMIGGIQADGSISHDNEITVLDGGESKQILSLKTHAKNALLNIRIIGLTLKNGYSSDDGDPKTIDHGAAICAYEGDYDSTGVILLSVEHCKLLNNKTTGSLSGGAIFSNCLVRLYDCEFRKNEAYNGGAIYAATPVSGDRTDEFIVEECRFEENKNFGNQGSSIFHNLTLKVNRSFFLGMLDGSEVGPGSCIWGDIYSTTYVSHSAFTKIICKYWGAAIQSFGGNAYIDNCVFKKNKAGGVSGATDGYGALAFYHMDKPATTKRITNCTFVGNHSRYGEATYGGAIHNRGKNEDDFKVKNCIFWDNGTMPVVTQMGVASISYSNIQGATLTGFLDGGSNINADPLFADTLYHLQSGSPCINMGNNTFDPAAEEDFDGNPRILSETVDMGAYEYNTAPDSIRLEITVFEENLDSAAIVATVTGYDPDPEDMPGMRYALRPGEGDDDNDLFVLDGQDLKFLEVGDYEEDSVYHIRVGIMDAGDSTFAESFTLKLADGNDPILLTGTLDAEQSIQAGSAYSYTYPENLVSDQDGPETVSVSVSLDDDSALPDWLTFTPETRTFSGTPTNADVDSLNIKIKFTDDGEYTLTLNFGLKIEFTSSIENNAFAGIQIYPNPARDHAMLSFDPATGLKTLKIYNLTGECVMDINDISNSPHKLDLSNLKTGLYLLETGNNTKHYLKLVKY